MKIDFPTIIGTGGVLIILVTYFLLMSNRLPASSYLYSILNMLGGFMILFSLFYAWNLSAVLMEVAWILISLFGIVKQYVRSRHTA
jgi:hypothetical protein